jgi:hypothetical protein
MKVLKIFYMIMICFFNSTLNAQVKVAEGEQEIIATFAINDARENGNDVTSRSLERNCSLSFYKIPDSDNIQLCNLCALDDSQSYGPIYFVVKEEHPRTEKDLKSELFNFYWSYNNTYDENKGTAKAKLFVVHKPQGIYYELTMVLENLDVLVYKGSMNGNLDSLAFE